MISGQPVLVGTISIEKSEDSGELLKRQGIPHEVLNAKHHEQEAEIVAQAGAVSAMSPLPPTWPAAAPTSSWGEGALVEQWRPPSILATERHEARRIDNQLRGRSGRQGDPGSSPVSICPWRTTCSASSAPTGIKGLMERLGMEEGEPSSTAWSPRPSKTPRSGWKPTTSTSANTSWSTTTS